MYWITANIPELAAIQDRATKNDVKKSAILKARLRLNMILVAVMFLALNLVTILNVSNNFTPTLTQHGLQNLVSGGLLFLMIGMPWRNKIIRQEVKLATSRNNHT